MSKKISLILAASIAVGCGIWLASQQNPNTPEIQTSELTADKPTKRANSPTTAAAPNIIDSMEENAHDFVSNKQLLQIRNTHRKTSKSYSEQHRVVKILKEIYLDPASKNSRRRVRFIESDGKYSNIKLEEIVTTDPDTGEQSILTLKNSVADHLTVGIKSGENVEKVSQQLQDLGYSIRKQRPSYLLVTIENFVDPNSQANNIANIEKSLNAVSFAETDNFRYKAVAPNDTLYGDMYAMNNTGQTGGSFDADIDAPEGWDAQNDASGVVVAILDGGINYLHEDLVDNMWRNPNDNTFGIDTGDNDNDPIDTDGHGTHVAGTVGARGNNGIGVTGVAWRVQLMACKVFGDGQAGAVSSDIADGITFASNNGANIINASLGGPGSSQLVSNSIRTCNDLEIAFIAAAGNDSTDNDTIAQFPCGYDIPNIVCVGSSNNFDNLSVFSNFGENTVDLVAPGSEIISTWFDANDSYNTISGTSMASPTVAGAMALAYAHFPNLSMGQKIGRLLCSVDPIQSLEGVIATAGRLNVNTLLTGDLSLQNDHFADAFQSNTRYQSWRMCNLIEGTREADENNFSQPGTGIHSAWQTWTAPYTGFGLIKGSADSAPLRVVIYEGGDRSNLTEIYDSLDNASFNPKKEFSFPFNFTAGVKYTILLDTLRDDVGFLPARATITAFPRNDNFKNATEITSVDFTSTENNTNSSPQHWELTGGRDGTAISHGPNAAGNSIWWKWTATFTGDITFTSQGAEQFGNTFSTTTAVYTGTPNKASGDWTKISQDSQGDASKTVRVTEGITYYIAVDGVDEGEITLQGSATITNLAINVVGNGTVTTASNTLQYNNAQTAQLTATPAAGWTFGSWTGVTSSSANTANVLMDSSKTVTAKFNQSLASWKAANLNGLTSMTGNADDPDNDGKSNIQEYLHGSNPMITSSTGIINTHLTDTNCICVTFTRNQGISAPYEIGAESSLDMANWSTANVTETVISSSNGVETVKAELPLATGSTGFIRVYYTTP